MAVNFSYYYLLYSAYGVALTAWWIIYRKTDLWNGEPESHFSKPWLEVGFIFILAVLTILVGRLYTADLLLPSRKLGDLYWSEAINQLIIFSPFPLYLLIRKQSLSTAWIKTDKIVYRLLIGLCLSAASIFIFSLSRGTDGFFNMIGNVYHYKNFHHGVQVFLEDLAIGMLLCRLLAAMKEKYFMVALVVVSFLFAIGHLPSKMESGIPLSQSLFDLVLDMGLTIGVAFCLKKSRDILWFFPIHYAMDMMQFYSGLKLE